MNNAADADEIQVEAAWGEWPAPQQPQMPQMPPYLINFQAWLAAQGLAVQDGVLPEDNISDSAAQAWNDSITVYEESSSDGSNHALIINEEPLVPLNLDPTSKALTVTVNVHNQGMQFGLSAQGDEILSLLLTDPIPHQQLNHLLYSALRPLLATVGPWVGGYGTR